MSGSNCSPRVEKPKHNPLSLQRPSNGRAILRPKSSTREEHGKNQGLGIKMYKEIFLTCLGPMSLLGSSRGVITRLDL